LRASEYTFFVIILFYKVTRLAQNLKILKESYFYNPTFTFAQERIIIKYKGD